MRCVEYILFLGNMMKKNLKNLENFFVEGVKMQKSRVFARDFVLCSSSCSI